MNKKIDSLIIFKKNYISSLVIGNMISPLPSSDDLQCFEHLLLVLKPTLSSSSMLCVNIFFAMSQSVAFGNREESSVVLSKQKSSHTKYITFKTFHLQTHQCSILECPCTMNLKVALPRIEWLLNHNICNM
jgi:hypothetical protein